MTRICLRLAALATIVAAGCDGGPPVAPVSGVVTYDGAPLVGATITTQPVGRDSKSPGSGSFGKTDDQGRFELELVKPEKKGAVIGLHRVMISPAASSEPPAAPKVGADGVEIFTDDPNSRFQAAKAAWPTRYSDGSLTLEVPPEGRDDVRFDLER